MDYDKSRDCLKTTKKEEGVNYIDIMRLFY